ncbi:hypothetical protein GCM10020331_022820 [Ectobacillus funiculus]
MIYGEERKCLTRESRAIFSRGTERIVYDRACLCDSRGQKKQATAFRDIVEEVSETLGLSKEQVTVRLAQFLYRFER